MKRFITLAVLATTFALSSLNFVHAHGCGGHRGISIGLGGGGIRIGGGGHGGPIRNHVHQGDHAPHYAQPVQAPYYPQPAPPVAYSQPSYQQPSYPQSGYPQSGFPQPTNPQRVNAQPVSAPLAQGQAGFPQSNGGPAMQAGGNMPNQQGANVGQQANTFQNPNAQNGGFNGQMQAGSGTQMPQNQSNFAGQQPSAGQANVGGAAQGAGFAQNAQQQLAAPSSQNQIAPATATESSALQLLASLGGEVAGSASAELEMAASIETAMPANGMQPGGAHVGSWNVTLPGNQVISLVLGADNNFQWTAMKDGKSSSFQGQYLIDAGRLTLVRSTDLQQMAGSWNGEGANFTFKLDGATTSGMAFTRSE